MFGKLMSVSDELMWRYIELLSFESLADHREVEGKRSTPGRNPRDIKVRFAQEIVARFHDQAAAEQALADFEARFRHGGVPDDMPEQVIEVPAEGGADRAGAEARRGSCPSTSEAMRMIEQGGVRAERREGQRQGARACPPGASVRAAGRQAQVRPGHA